MVADDMQHVVKDKREGWRASSSKARRRQRRYTKLLVGHLLKTGGEVADTDDDAAPEV